MCIRIKQTCLIRTLSSKSWVYNSSVSLFIIILGRMEWKEKTGKEKAYLFGPPVLLANIHLLLGETGVNSLDNGLLFLELLHLHALSTTGSLLADSLESLSDKLQILGSQLLIDDGKITDWIDITLDVDNFGIIEASNDLEDGIYGTNVRQEGISETGTGGGTSS
jgi:hypothetical protein